MTTDGEDRLEVQLARTRALEPDFLGLELDEARLLADRLGLELRPIETIDTPVTLDLRSNRMTVVIGTGTVSWAHAG
jgi:hypothetical protein